MTHALMGSSFRQYRLKTAITSSSFKNQRELKKRYGQRERRSKQTQASMARTDGKRIIQCGKVFHWLRWRSRTAALMTMLGHSCTRAHGWTRTVTTVQ